MAWTALLIIWIRPSLHSSSLAAATFARFQDLSALDTFFRSFHASLTILAVPQRSLSSATVSARSIQFSTLVSLGGWSAEVVPFFFSSIGPPSSGATRVNNANEMIEINPYVRKALVLVLAFSITPQDELRSLPTNEHANNSDQKAKREYLIQSVHFVFLLCLLVFRAVELRSVRRRGQVVCGGWGVYFGWLCARMKNELLVLDCGMLVIVPIAWVPELSGVVIYVFEPFLLVSLLRVSVTRC